jgi:hypothetical protein
VVGQAPEDGCGRGVAAAGRWRSPKRGGSQLGGEFVNGLDRGPSLAQIKDCSADHCRRTCLGRGGDRGGAAQPQGG